MSRLMPRFLVTALITVLAPWSAMSAEQAYVTRTPTVYHRQDCARLRFGTAIDLDEAKSRYAPCPVCQPETPRASTSATPQSLAESKPPSLPRAVANPPESDRSAKVSPAAPASRERDVDVVTAAHATGFAELTHYSDLVAGEQITVTDRSGTTDCVFRSLDSGLLSCSTGGVTKGYGEQDVLGISVRRPDSLRNGLFLGALVGVPAGLFAGQGMDEDASVVVTTLMGAAIYAAIGAGIDALIKRRETVYRRQPTPRADLNVGVLPAATARGAAVVVGLRF